MGAAARRCTDITQALVRAATHHRGAQVAHGGGEVVEAGHLQKKKGKERNDSKKTSKLYTSKSGTPHNTKHIVTGK